MGKTSIIEVLITATFEEEVQPVLPVLVVPKDVTPERVHVEIVDTPGAEEQSEKVDEELQKADVIVLVYAVNNESSQDRISKYWMKKFRDQGVSVPVVLVGNKIDTRGGISDPSAAVKMEAFIKPIMDNYKQVDVCIECSAKTVSNISEVFYFAQKAVLHPTGPLYNVDEGVLKPPAVAALRRIFKLCDKDEDGGLNDKELNEFQYACFNVHLQPDELAGVKNVVKEKTKDGIRDDGSISVTGFIFLHTLFVNKGRLETTWIVLRKFGYDDDLRLALDGKSSITHSADQCVELTTHGKDFLKKLFSIADKDSDGAISPEELEGIFEDHPDGPFYCSSDVPAGERLIKTERGQKAGYITRDSFMARWALYVADHPNDALLSLQYLNLTGNLQNAVRVSKSRKRDRHYRTVSREVFNVFLLGDDYAEKCDIIRGLVEHASTGADSPGLAAVSLMSDEDGGEQESVVIVRDVRFLTPKNLGSQREQLDRADVVCIAFDGASKKSFEYAKALLEGIKEEADVRVPVVFVCSLDNVEGESEVLQEADTLCEEALLPSPVRVSMRDGEDGDLYKDLLGVAKHPDVACPNYYDRSGSGSFTSSTVLQVTVGALAVSGLVYGAKKLYDYTKSTNTTTS